MRRIVLVVLVILLIVPMVQSFAGEATKLETAYNNAVQAKKASTSKLVDGALVKYGAGIQKARETLQKQGELDAVLALMEEQKRFVKEQTIPETPSATAPDVLKKLQREYLGLTIKATTERDDYLSKIKERYIQQLELMKKQLTMDGNIDEAIAIHEKLQKLQKKEAVTVVAKTHASVPMMECSMCRGTGKAPCADCEGDRKCTKCDGGSRPPKMKGSSVRERCPYCKGKDECRTCQGTGGSSEKCDNCYGVGKVKRTVGDDDIDDESVASGKSKPSTSVKKLSKAELAKMKAQAKAEMDAYKNAMLDLNKKCQDGHATEKDLIEVIADPNSHIGNLYKCEAYITFSHSKGVKVGSDRADAKTNPTLLKAFSSSVGIKSKKVHKEVGSAGKVVITYGVVGKDNIMLFDIEAAR